MMEFTPADFGREDGAADALAGKPPANFRPALGTGGPIDTADEEYRRAYLDAYREAQQGMAEQPAPRTFGGTA